MTNPITNNCPRITPVPRTAGVEESLAARLADPLWLLARQWQFGEFRGDDAGSPVSVQLAATAHRPTWWRPEPDSTHPEAKPYQDWHIGSGPLETLIEAEADDGTAWLRIRLEGGVRARRSLIGAGLANAAARVAALAPWHDEDIAAATNPIDRAGLMTAADGADLAARISPWADPSTSVPAEILTALGVPDTQAAAVGTVLRTWLSWWTQRSAGLAGAAPVTGLIDPPAWDPHRLEHRGSLAFASAPDTRLQIDRHPGGPLDWYSVDIRTGDPAELPTLPASSPGVAMPVQFTAVPQPATFAGMPARRFWEFEDAYVDFGSIDASGGDLARLLMVEYSTVYDHDWYVTPVRVPVGALVHVDQPVAVKDSFGMSYPLEPFAAKPGAHTRIFTLDTPDSTAPSAAAWSTRWFWFAPRLPAVLNGDPLETVALRRDEMADLAWAIVSATADRFGRPTAVNADVVAAAPNDGTPRYTAESPVAQNWFPLDPTQLTNLGAYRLVLKSLLRGPDGAMSVPPGWLLAAPPNADHTAGQWWIYEEELARAGASLNRAVTIGRWHDGRLFRWTSRNAWLGGGEASSGLTWDYLF